MGNGCINPEPGLWALGPGLCFGPAFWPLVVADAARFNRRHEKWIR